MVADWPGLPGGDLVGESPEAPAGVAMCGMDAYEAVRIEAGIPVMGRELDERTIPAEAGVVDMSVSFTKGCYTGQELVARIDSRGGNVPRRLRGLVLADGAGAGRAPRVQADGKDVGQADQRGVLARARRHRRPGLRAPRRRAAGGGYRGVGRRFVAGPGRGPAAGALRVRRLFVVLLGVLAGCRRAATATPAAAPDTTIGGRTTHVDDHGAHHHGEADHHVDHR